MRMPIPTTATAITTFAPSTAVAMSGLVYSLFAMELSMESWEPLAKLMATAGISVILAWYLWYEKAKAEPRRERLRQDELQAVRDSHSKDLADIVAEFRNEFKEQRSLSQHSQELVIEIVRKCQGGKP